MGAVSVSGIRTRADGSQVEVRLSGSFTHNGPHSVLQLRGGGRGWVQWRDRVGSGTYVFRERSYDFEVIYSASGHYSYKVISSAEVVCRGRIREEQASLPAEPQPDHHRPAM